MRVAVKTGQRQVRCDRRSSVLSCNYVINLKRGPIEARSHLTVLTAISGAQSNFTFELLIHELSREMA